MIVEYKTREADGHLKKIQKDVKVIKEYNNFILVEHPEGFKECINKQELGMVTETKVEKYGAILRGITGNRV